MPIDNDLVEEVLKHADIVNIIGSYLPLKKQGKDYIALCPFHDDSNPSMHISPERQIFKCFVCGTGGSAISFVQKYEHMSFFEAMVKVAELSSFDDPRLHKNTYVKKVDEEKEALFKCTKDLTTYYQYTLSTSEGKDGLEYFESRHLDAAMRERFKLGFAPFDGVKTCKFLQSKGHSIKTIEDIGIGKVYGGSLTDHNRGRVIFPICDADGNVVGYSARRIKDGPEAKYVNTTGTALFQKSNILYNYHIAKDKARLAGYIYVLEGFMDVFALAKIGIDSAVAIMGTELTKEHIQMLRKLNVEVRVCLDGDNPGQDAMLKIANNLQKAGIDFMLVDNQGSPKDPDEILNQDGEAKLREYLNHLVGMVDFALNYYQRTNPLRTIKEKETLVGKFISILKNITSQLQLDSYIRKLADITGFEKESIRELVNKAKAEPQKETEKIMSSFHPERKILKRLQLAEREYLFQMLHNKPAVKIYEEKVGGFYDEVYRALASYIIEYVKNHDDIDYIGVLAMLEASELPNKDELIDELSQIIAEKNHPTECTEELLSNLIDAMMEEKTNIFEDYALEESLNGKTPLERARIYAEYNRRKMKREADKDKKKKDLI